MVEYIRRDIAVKIAERYGLTNGSVLGRHTGLADCIASEISDLPAADVVEVVRCRDCKHYRERAGRSMCAERAVRLDGHEAGLLTTYKNNFCSLGKRRENDGRS